MLTNLRSLKAMLNITEESEDAKLAALIDQVSGMILSYLSRPHIFRRQWTETFFGSDQTAKMLKNYPVVGVSSVTAGGSNLNSYWLDDDDGVPPGRLQRVNLTSGRFQGQCKVIYEAGYCIKDEAHTAAPIVTVDAPWGAWAVDGGVAYATGGKLTKVASSPSVGQYALGKPGQYIFASGDTGSVLISYSYIPAAIERACVKIVMEQYSYLSRIGQRSVNIQGQVVTYDLSDMPADIKLSLQPFRRLVPV